MKEIINQVSIYKHTTVFFFSYTGLFKDRDVS